MQHFTLSWLLNQYPQFFSQTSSLLVEMLTMRTLSQIKPCPRPGQLNQSHQIFIKVTIILTRHQSLINQIARARSNRVTWLSCTIGLCYALCYRAMIWLTGGRISGWLTCNYPLSSIVTTIRRKDPSFFLFFRILLFFKLIILQH